MGTVKHKNTSSKAKTSFKTFPEFMERLIAASNRCITEQAPFLKPDVVIFHKGAHKAYKTALEIYRRYHND